MFSLLIPTLQIPRSVEQTLIPPAALMSPRILVQLLPPHLTPSGQLSLWPLSRTQTSCPLLPVYWLWFCSRSPPLSKVQDKVAPAADPDQQPRTGQTQKIQARSWLPGVYPDSVDVLGELTLTSHTAARLFQDDCPWEGPGYSAAVPCNGIGCTATVHCRLAILGVALGLDSDVSGLIRSLGKKIKNKGEFLLNKLCPIMMSTIPG